MKVAVVTAYFTEPRAILEQNLSSVRTQGHPHCKHIVVADGHPQPWLDGAGPLHIVLPVNTNDWGDTPRSVGMAFASSAGYDAITFLDADCYLLPGAIEAYVAAALQARVPLVVGRRLFVREDGSHLAAEDSPAHIDTNCYFFTRAGFGVLMKWAGIPSMFHVMGDRVMRLAVTAAALPYVVVSQPTVAYRTAYAVHYRLAGEVPPPNAKDLRLAFARAYQKWQTLDASERAAYCAALGFGIKATVDGLQMCGAKDA
jgi:hypothetical protein